jgi:DNA-binding CsgD family transcriptional regulator
MLTQTSAYRVSDNPIAGLRADRSNRHHANRASQSIDNAQAELVESKSSSQSAAIYLLTRPLQVEFHNRVNIFGNTDPLFVVDHSSTLRFLDSKIETAVRQGIEKTLDGSKHWSLLFNAPGTHRVCYQFSLYLAKHQNLIDCNNLTDQQYVADHKGSTPPSARTRYQYASEPSGQLFLILIARKLERSKDRLVEVAAAHWGLSETEKHVLSLIIDGVPNKEIARQRQVSPETVKQQSVSILSKSGCDNRTMLASQVFYYLEQQLSGNTLLVT